MMTMDDDDDTIYTHLSHWHQPGHEMRQAEVNLKLQELYNNCQFNTVQWGSDTESNDHIKME